MLTQVAATSPGMLALLNTGNLSPFNSYDIGPQVFFNNQADHECMCLTN